MNPTLMELSGLAIERTDNAHLGIKDGLVLRLSIKPVATQVRFDLRGSVPDLLLIELFPKYIKGL
jgi:hypothetical protein